MSDNFQHIDVDSDEFIDAPKALRDHVKKIQNRLTEVQRAHDTLRGTVTDSALTDVLGGFKNPERVKRDLLADKIDPLDKSAVNEWLAANSDDYARGDGATTTSQSNANEAEAAAHQQFNAGAGLQQPADMSKLDAALAGAGANPTGADLIAQFKAKGL